MALTFRSRLMVWFVATVGVLLALAVAALVYSSERLRERQVDEALRAIAAARADEVAGLGFVKSGGERKDFLTVIDRSHAVRGNSDNLRGPLPFDAEAVDRAIRGETVFRTTEAAGLGRLRLIYERLPDSSGTIVVGVPENLFGAEMDRFRTAILAAAVALLMIAAASAYLLAERALRPIITVSEAVRKVTAGNLRESLPASGTSDEIAKMVQVFNEMLGRLDESFRAQRRFSSRVAHELRTPLTIMKGETQVALNRRRSIEEYEALLKSSLEEVAKMEKTVDELLLFARYEAGETEMPLRPVQIDAVIGDVVKDLRPVAEGRAIDIAVDTPEEVLVHGDEQALSRLVCKLVENALQYTPDGGKVTVRVLIEAGRTLLAVRDTGIGIPPDDVPHVFERFYRSQSSKHMHPDGSGIGLAMVDVIARLHQARTTVNSRPNDGTEFVISFPPIEQTSGRGRGARTKING